MAFTVKWFTLECNILYLFVLIMWLKNVYLPKEISNTSKSLEIFDRKIRKKLKISWVCFLLFCVLPLKVFIVHGTKKREFIVVKPFEKNHLLTRKEKLYISQWVAYCLCCDSIRNRARSPPAPNENYHMKSTYHNWMYRQNRIFPSL